MTDTLDDLFWKDVARLPVNLNVTTLYMSVINLMDLSDKKKKFFVYKLKLNSQKLGFIHNLILSNAIIYNVPHVYIKQCVQTRKMYNYYNKIKVKNDYASIQCKSIKPKLNMLFNDLATATYENMVRKQSRKEKIYNVLENIDNGQKS